MTAVKNLVSTIEELNKQIQETEHIRLQNKELLV